MFRALKTAALGMSSQQLQVDNIANNLANVNTTGFKRSTIAFQDLYYQTMASSKRASALNSVNNDGQELQIGHGSRAVSTIRNFTQGSLQDTGNPLDMAINGDGFFQITMPDGKIAYSRDGNFRLNAEGLMVTPNGLALAQMIEIPQDAIAIQVTADGIVSAQLSESAQPMELGQIELAKFVNPGGLRALGDNLYEMTEQSGEPFIGMPGLEGYGTVRQSFLEGSNVDIVNEMVGLITAQRSYETNSKMVQTAEDMMRMVNSLKR